MARFVEDLLLLAKAEQADFLQPGPLDLDVLTDELYAKAQALADRDWGLVGNGTGRLIADRQRLTQAIMQLAQNAVQHTEPGDRIALGSALAGDTARLWVADSGPGVPAAEREHSFDRLHRAADGRRRSDASEKDNTRTRARRRLRWRGARSSSLAAVAAEVAARQRSPETGLPPPPSTLVTA